MLLSLSSIPQSTLNSRTATHAVLFNKFLKLASHLLNFSIHSQLFIITNKELHIFFMVFESTILSLSTLPSILSGTHFFNYPPSMLSLHNTIMWSGIFPTIPIRLHYMIQISRDITSHQNKVSHTPFHIIPWSTQLILVYTHVLGVRNTHLLLKL